MSDLMNRLTEQDLEELLREIRRKRTGKKLDWENMTEEQRHAVNRPTTPVTPMVPYQEYPRALYAIQDGRVMTTTVEDAEHEAEVRALGLDWGYKIPIETCPSSGVGRAVITELNVPDAQARLVAQLNAPTAPKPGEFGPLAAAAAKRSPGRPRKTA